MSQIEEMVYKDSESNEINSEVNTSTKSSRAGKNAICDQCGKNFTNIYTMIIHKKQIHDGFKPFSCGICGTRFATKFKLKRHHLGVHADKRDFRCDSCSNSFKTRDMLIKHQRTHFTGLGPFICQICDEEFKFKSGLDHHTLLKHSVKSSLKEKQKIYYKCSLCEKVYKTMKTLERHERSHLMEINCKEPNHEESEENCVEAFQDFEINENTEHKSMTCRYCLKTYKTASNFEAHLLMHENEESMQDYECVISEIQGDEYFEEHCDNLVDDESLTGIPRDLMKNIDESMVMVEKIETKRFVQDVEVVAELDPEEVDKISVNFTGNDESENYLIEQDDVNDLYDTIIAEELEPSELEVISQESAIYFEDNNRLESTENKPKKNANEKEKSVCDECGAEFKNNSHLKRHVLRKHRKDSHKIECHVCEAKFLLNYDLKRHMIKHTDNRDFLCDLCQQSFKTSLSLKNHTKIVHSEDRPLERRFICKICGRSYLHQRHLDYHSRKHTGDAKYSCELCKPEMHFFYSDAVKWHKIRHHGEMAPFKCSICSKKFIHARSLESHEKEHAEGSGSLAVRCQICQKLISEKRHMKRHLRSHMSKEFPCGSCGDTFKERHQLTKHSKSCDQKTKE